MITFLLILVYSRDALAYGYDAGSDHAACGKNFRQSRAFQPPCNLAEENYCTQAGSRYPWHAVRRFVRENQGLMKRMYGEQRHFSVIQQELDPEDLDLDQFNEINFRYRRFNGDGILREGSFEGRYMQDDFDDDNELFFVESDESQGRAFPDEKPGEVLNAKFVYSEEGEIVKAQVTEIKNIPRFRESSTVATPAAKPVQTFVTESTTMTSTNTEPSTVKSGTTTVSTRNVKVSTETGEVNVTESLASEFGNATDFPIELKNTSGSDTFTSNSTERTTSEFLTSTEKATVADNLKTSTAGEMLFQDVEEQSTKRTPQNNRLNYEKLKGVNACPVKEEVVAPFWANNTRGEVLALLNLYPFEQYVHWEKCTYEHKQMYCREGCRCEQQYRLHRLLAYDPNNECRGIFSDWFKFPSCCVCKCYNIPSDFRVTSRSPRRKSKDLDGSKKLPEWIQSHSNQVEDY